MIPSFDLEKFLQKSRALDLSGIDWSKARTQPVSEAEVRCLTYMIDIESYTIAYMKDLLNTTAIKDREIADFLPCWAYEESYHGRALERFLLEAGLDLDPERKRSYQRREPLFESFRDFGAAVLSRFFRSDFVAVYLAWGAIQELTTLTGYNNLARKTGNEVIAEIVRRIMRDEARHFGFYYNKAMERLSHSKNAQRLTSFLVKHFWLPVGAGIKSDSEVTFIMAYIFGDEEGRKSVCQVDATIRKLPGLGWFDRLEASVRENCQRLIEQAPWRTT
jgi:rubrerythrin